MRRGGSAAILAVLAMTLAASQPHRAVAARPETPPDPQPAVRSVKTSPVATDAVAKPPSAPDVSMGERQKRLAAVKSWAYQLSGATVPAIAASPFDLVIVDATAGFATGKPLTRADLDRLKKKPDGGRRLVIAYLSIGDVEMARRDILGKEFFDEDPPEWLLHESPDWKGHRFVNICAEGWQKTLLGDTNGRSVYDSISAAPLTRLIDMGIDGVLLDRVDVYADIAKACPDAETKMTAFVARIASAARRTDPNVLVLQNGAEDLLKHSSQTQSIDGVVSEALTPADAATVSADAVKAAIARLTAAKAQGRTVLTVEYVTTKAGADAAVKRSRDGGFVPTLAPKDLGELWLPGRTF